MWAPILNLTLGCGCSKGQQRTHKKKEKFLSFPDPSPFLLTSVPPPRTEFTDFISSSMISSWCASHTHSSGHTEATVLRRLQVLILGRRRGPHTLSSRPDSPTYISITQRHHLCPVWFLMSFNKKTLWLTGRKDERNEPREPNRESLQSWACRNSKIW